MRRNGSGVGCPGKSVKSQAPLCACVREKERGKEKEREKERKREGKAGTPDLEPKCYTAFRIRGGERCSMALDLVMGWVFISIKSEAKLSPLYVPTL